MCSSPLATKDVYTRMTVAEKKLNAYPNMLHDRMLFFLRKSYLNWCLLVHFEPGKEQVIQDYTQWMLDMSAKHPAKQN